MSTVDEEVSRRADLLLNAALTNCADSSQLVTYETADRWLKRNKHGVTISHEDGYVTDDAYRLHMMAANLAIDYLEVLRRRYIYTTLAMLERAPVRAPQRGNG